MSARVAPFFHQDSSTCSHVVHAAGDARAAIIDPVLDFDRKSARTGEALVFVAALLAGSQLARLVAMPA